VTREYRKKRNARIRATLAMATSAYLLVSPCARAGQVDREVNLSPVANDVFVVDGGFLRNPDGSTPLDAQLRNVAGTSLGVTWGQFKSASATATAHCIGSPAAPRTSVRITLTGLIPGGIYSIFYATFGPDSDDPLCPGVDRTVPLTAFHPENQLPDASSFVADENGDAEYRSEVEGCLLDAGKLVYAVIYHANGQTYHPLPNLGEFLTQGPDCRDSYGADAMRQLLINQKQ
jgi:hypothetical protein